MLSVPINDSLSIRSRWRRSLEEQRGTDIDRGCFLKTRDRIERTMCETVDAMREVRGRLTQDRSVQRLPFSNSREWMKNYMGLNIWHTNSSNNHTRGMVVTRFRCREPLSGRDIEGG